ncbi:MAG: glycosyl transferase group 1, partial [Betaproteobacteria bacterium]|nr:glycosyl transferase group 1 [Betaproteobacteria bacterium]
FSGIKSKFPSWHLVYAGPDAGMLNNLRNKAQDDGLAERVHFLGYLGGRDKAAAYAAAGLLAIPSRQEAMSIVVLEAGVRKTPVLLTDQCGMNIVAKYGGKVVAATADGLESGLEEMLSAAHDLKRRGEELANFVRTNYLWNTVVQGYIAEYDELLRKRAA